MSATLIVYRANGDARRYLLRWGAAARLEVEHELDPELLAQLRAELGGLTGLGDRRPDLLQLGRTVWSELLPETLRRQLGELDEPLTIVADDPSLPWELAHDGDDYLALRQPLARYPLVLYQLAELLRGDACDATEAPAAATGAASLPDLRAALAEAPGVILSAPLEYDPVDAEAALRLAGESVRGVELLALGLPQRWYCLVDSGGEVPLAWPEAAGRAESLATALLAGGGNGGASGVLVGQWPSPDSRLPSAFAAQLGDGQPLGLAILAARRATADHGPAAWAGMAYYGPQTADSVVGPMQPQLAAAPPLDAAARAALVAAITEARRGEQRVLTTLHLVFGLLGLEHNGLLEALRAAPLDPAEVRRTLRQQLAQVVVTSDYPSGLSRNAAAAVVDAARAAGAARAARTTCEHLTAAFGARSESQAGRVLAGLGLGVGAVGSTPSFETRTLDDWPLDPFTRQAVSAGIQLALGAGLAYLGTPHLLLGLLTCGGRVTTDLLRRHRVPTEELAARLSAGMGQPGGQPAQALAVTQRCFGTLRRAQELAEQADGFIRETQLLRAILEDGTGFTAETLRSLGAEPGQLEAELRE